MDLTWPSSVNAAGSDSTKEKVGKSLAKHFNFGNILLDVKKILRKSNRIYVK